MLVVLLLEKSRGFVSVAVFVALNRLVAVIAGFSFRFAGAKVVVPDVWWWCRASENEFRSVWNVGRRGAAEEEKEALQKSASLRTGRVAERAEGTHALGIPSRTLQIQI